MNLKDKIKIYRQTIQTLDESTDDYLYVLDLQNRRVFFTDKICGKYDLPLSGEEGICLNDWFHIVYKKDQKILEENMSQIFAGKNKVHDLDYRLIDRTEKRVWITCKGAVQVSEEGEPELLVGSVSERAIGSMVDSLTGLKNKEKFMKDMEYSLKEKSGYILILGIDDFKKINIKNGRIFGDQILRLVTDILEENVDYPVTLYRLDGDRFAVNFPEKEEEGVSDFYAAVKQKIEKYCTVSAGAVSYKKEKKESRDRIYQYVENALDRAKKEGKNKLVFFSSEMYQKNLEQLQLQDEIETGIREGFKGFYLCYQPLLRNQDFLIHGAEALLRFESPSRGNVSPGEFIPFLEQSGLICQVGTWVFQTAVRQCVEWRRWFPDFHININVSYIQLRQEQIAETFLGILREEKLPGEAVTLEVTESMQLQDYRYYNKIFYQWKKYGIKIAIDDFGTGYSSLSYLKGIDIDEIKIDRIFVREIQNNGYHYRLLRNMIELAHSGGIFVCCEGVETEEELTVLRSLNPDILQGFLFSKPRTPEDVHQLCKNREPLIGRKKGDQWIPWQGKLAQMGTVLDLSAEDTIRKNDKKLLNFWQADILDHTGLGLWIIRLDEKTGTYEMYADEVMQRVLGLAEPLSGVECYYHWYNRVNDGYYHYIKLAMENMIQTGKIVQMEYTWNHPTKGEVLARSMGIRVEDSDGMVCIQGYHRLISDLERPNFISGGSKNEMFEFNEKKHTIYFHTDRKLMAGSEKKERNFPECWIEKKIVHPHFEKGFRELFQDVQKKNEVHGYELLLLNKQGSYEWVKLKTCHLGNLGRDAYTIVVFLEPAGQERAMELEYMRKSDFYEAILSETVAFAEVDVESGCLTFSGGLWASYVKEFQKHLVDLRKLLQKHIQENVYFEDREQYRKYLEISYMKEMSQKGIHTKKHSFRRYVNGKLCWMELVLHVFQDRFTENIYALLYLKNVDAVKKRELAQERAAERDPLTNVYNRSAFEQEVVRFMESKKDAKGALLILDMDDFKRINDRFGHLKGDETLQFFTGILQNTFRKGDLIGRLGGDEFLVFVKQVTDKEVMDKRMNQLFGKFHQIKEEAFTCSVGISFVQGEQFDYRDALGKADKAMYNSKKKGKNQYSYFEE